MKISNSVLSMIGLICLSIPIAGYTANTTAPVSTNKGHVNTWNQFAQRLYILHQHQTAQYETFQKESKGGYMDGGDFYREVKYYDKETERLLSRVLWEIDNPEQIHEIEVFGGCLYILCFPFLAGGCSLLVLMGPREQKLWAVCRSLTAYFEVSPQWMSFRALTQCPLRIAGRS